jgi:hypothetical protein
MDKTTKTVLIIIGSLLLVCACGASVIFVTGLWSFRTITRVADSSTSTDLADVANMLSEVAVITLPDGFGSPYGIHIADITSVGFASQSRNTHILITQFPQGTVIDTEEMLKLISQYSTNPDNPWDTSNTRVVEGKPVTIRGQETYLEISEGTSSDGTTYRIATATFQGKGGPSLLMIAGPLDEWDIEMVDTFIASIQ